MEKIMMYKSSNSKVNKIVTTLFIIGLCLVLAFSVIAPPIAYANEINQMFEVVGFIVGAVGGGYATSAVLAAAGVTTAAVFSSTVAALIVVIAAVGIGVGVASLVHILTSEESLDMFGVEFWRILSQCWDNTKMKFTCAANTFKWLVYQVKYRFGIEAPTAYASFPYEKIDSLSDIDNQKYFELSGSDDLPHFNYQNTILQHFSSSSDYNSINILSVNVNSFNPELNKDIVISLDIYNDSFLVQFSENKLRFSVSYDSSLPYAYAVSVPFLVGDELYFSCVKSWNKNKYIWRYDNHFPTFNDKSISFNNNKNAVTDGSLYYYFCKTDGTFIYPSSLANFFYYLFIMDYPVIASASPVTVEDTSELSEGTSSVLGNSTGLISELADATTIGKLSKESTYDKDKDIVAGLTGSIGSTSTGDVTITAAEVPNVTVDDTTDLSDAITITDVVADDVVSTDTDTPVNVDPQTYWITGINTLKIASSGISDKFPFCIPGYLKKQLNILVGEKKEPIFVIPFTIKSANINENITIDLTKFDKLLGVTDFFIVAILVVGLAFSTKKLLF